MTTYWKRWSPRRKRDLLLAIDEGSVSEDDVIKAHSLTEEELALWRDAFAANGAPGLRVTRLQVYRRIKRMQIL